ncbi:MAG TPA: hypothetical protein VHB72_00740 [Candidatus Saccharimonadales bacterium]|nr:hypothetical protein [Candidatus Saccharimonadales bacterium]
MKYPYTLDGNSSILLCDIAVPQLPDKIIFEGQELFVKDEFHITLVGAARLAKIISPDDQGSALDQIIQEFEEFVGVTPLKEYKISNNFRFVEKDERKTIIVMAEVPRIDELFNRLEQKFSLKLPHQQTHVTLYRYPQDIIGIAIPSAEDLQKFSRTIEVQELQKSFTIEG